MPLISVIVPVYKAEKYIHRCIDSIIAQTFTDFELILVDDGSPDNCGVICDDYAQRDSRIRVIHKSNGGVSSARNAGLDMASGAYIVFIDSDDSVDPAYLDVLYRNKQFDFVTAGFRMQRPDGNWKEYNFCDDSVGRDEVAAHPSRFMGKYYFGGPLGKMFRKEIIDAHNIRFPLDIHNGEDIIFTFSYLKYVSLIKIVLQSGYNYYFYSESLAHRWNANDFKWRICVEQKIADFFVPNSEVEEAWLDERCFSILTEQVRQHYPNLKKGELYKLYRHDVFRSCVQTKRKCGSMMERIFIFTMDHECYGVYFIMRQIERFFRRVKNKLRRMLKIKG